MQAALITQLIQRLFSKSPRFFRIMQIISVCFGALCAGAAFVISQNLLPVDRELADRWQNFLQITAAFFVGAFGGFSTGTTDPSLMDKMAKFNAYNDVKKNGI